MAGCTESVVKVDGTDVFMRRGGKGAPILFLHGAGGVGAWLPVFQQLSESFDVIVPDHPSFGKSPLPTWLDDIHDMAYFYLDFMKSLDLKGVHVVGQSLGGWIALEMAVRSVERIKSLTLVGAAGIHVKGKPKADIFMMAPEELTRSLFVDQKMIEAALAQTLTEEQEDILITNRVATARLGWQPRLFNPKLHKWLHRVTVPTHIVWGDSDKIIPPAYADAFKGLIAGSKVTMIKDAGHLPHIERTGPFLEAVTGFLKTAA